MAKKPEPGKLQSNHEPESFHELLRYCRERAKLTQRQLIDKLATFGCPYECSAISMWENGKRLPSDSGLFHYLGKALGLSEQEEGALVQAWIAEKNIRDLRGYFVFKQRERGAEFRDSKSTGGRGALK